MVCATLNLAYPKKTCVLHVVDMLYDVIVPESSTMFYVLCNRYITDCDIILGLYLFQLLILT